MGGPFKEGGHHKNHHPKILIGEVEQNKDSRSGACKQSKPLFDKLLNRSAVFTQKPGKEVKSRTTGNNA